LTVDESDGSVLKHNEVCAKVFSLLPGDEIFSLSRFRRSGRSKTSESRSSSKSSSFPERGRSTLSLTSLRGALSCSNSEAEDVEPTVYLVIRDTEPEKYGVSWTIRIQRPDAADYVFDVVAIPNPVGAFTSAKKDLKMLF
jgi:RNase adaptor protein for sRNA GlmZ degradation